MCVWSLRLPDHVRSSFLSFHAWSTVDGLRKMAMSCSPFVWLHWFHSGMFISESTAESQMKANISLFSSLFWPILHQLLLYCQIPIPAHAIKRLSWWFFVITSLGNLLSSFLPLIVDDTLSSSVSDFGLLALLAACMNFWINLSLFWLNSH